MVVMRVGRVVEVVKVIVVRRVAVIGVGHHVGDMSVQSAVVIVQVGVDRIIQGSEISAVRLVSSSAGALGCEFSK